LFALAQTVSHAAPRQRPNYSWDLSHAFDANKLAAQGQYLNTLLSSETVQ
jgi:hypothetical protein